MRKPKIEDSKQPTTTKAVQQQRDLTSFKVLANGLKRMTQLNEAQCVKIQNAPPAIMRAAPKLQKIQKAQREKMLMEANDTAAHFLGKPRVFKC